MATHFRSLVRFSWIQTAGSAYSVRRRRQVPGSGVGYAPARPWSTEGVSRRVRVYLPATLGTVAALHRDRQLPPGPAFAVTPALRAELAEDDQEELEYQAFQLAADASLALLRQDPAAPRRRVVVSADAVAQPVDGGRHGQVRLSGPVSVSAVAAIHLDDPEAEPDVAAAVTDGAALDEELSWYDVSELPQLVD